VQQHPILGYITLLIHVRDVLGSNVDPDSGCVEEFAVPFSRYRQILG
jgi:hypothetical protein